MRTLATSLISTAAIASTYYVAPGGNDGADGSMLTPWATLQHAADSVAPGDTVAVEPGNYTGFYQTTSGTAMLPIVWTAAPGTIVDADNAITPDGINLEGASFVVVEGFEVAFATRTGIRAVECDGVTIRGNFAHDSGRWGILTGCCDDLLIENNEMSASVAEHGIYVGNSGDRPTIRGNVVHDNHANGIHMNGDASIICNTTAADGVISGALVEANVIFGNGAGGGSGVNCDGVQDSRIVNNLIYDHHSSGISLYQIDGGQPSSGNVVVNNTVVVAADGRWALNIQDDATDTTAFNNILWSWHAFRGSIDACAGCLTGLQSDHNVVMDRLTTDGGGSVLTLAQWQAMTGQDANSIVSDPPSVFVDEPADDYHLLAAGPAIDTGTSVQAPPDDLDGVARPVGPEFDVGCYEWCPATGCVGAGGEPAVDAGAGAGEPGVDAGAGAAEPGVDSGTGAMEPGVDTGGGTADSGVDAGAAAGEPAIDAGEGEAEAESEAEAEAEAESEGEGSGGGSGGCACSIGAPVRY